MKKKMRQSKIRAVLEDLLNSDFFNKGKTTSEVINKLSQRGFTIKGKKVGMVARMLTQICQDADAGLERFEIPEREREKGEKWMFRKTK